MIAVGVGARSGVAVHGPVRAALAAAGIGPAEVTVLATLDRRAAEDRFRVLAAGFGWRLAAFTAAQLSVVPVPNPGHASTAATGTLVMLRDPVLSGTLLFESVAGTLPERLAIRARSAGAPGRFKLRYYALEVLPR